MDSIFLDYPLFGKSPKDYLRNYYKASYIAGLLMQKGYKIYNPLYILDLYRIANREPMKITEEDYIKFNIPWLEIIDSILSLNGESYFYTEAKRMGKKIYKSIKSIKGVKKSVEDRDYFKTVDDKIVDEILKNSSINLSKFKGGIRIYIAGPYTSNSIKGLEENIKRASIIGYYLFKQDFRPYVPHIATDLPDNLFHFDWEFWMLQDKFFLEKSDAILFIDKSKGANIELYYAWKIGKPIIKF